MGPISLSNPAHSWTVDEFARKVGLSRSALAQRFTNLLGQPPMQYLRGGVCKSRHRNS